MNSDTAAMLSAVAAGVSALAAIVTALLASWTLSNARADSRERTRPVLIAQLRRAVLSRGSLDLVISNYGASSARDVRVHFEPPILNPEQLPISDMRHWIGMRYRRPIAAIGPGMSLSNVYRAGHDDVPPVTVKIAYKGSDGRGYHEHFYLDPEVLVKESHSGPAEGTATDKRVVRALEAIARALDRSA